jgi:Transposase IS4
LNPVERNDFCPIIVGPNHGLDADASALEIFSVFLNIFFQEMVHHTNSYAARERARAETGPHPHLNHWTDTTVPEIRAFVAINIAMGLNSPSEINDIWSTEAYVRVPDLSRIMTKARYWSLNRYIHIADDTTAVTDRKHPGYDSLHKVRDMINLANARFAEVYKPRQHLSVDESMVLFKGRHMSKQYMPNKPVKWGFKFWMVAEAATGYCLRVELYEGKNRGEARNATVRKYGLGYDVVDTLTENYQKRNHVVYYDRFFSSVQLAEDLLSKETYVNSTVMLNRKGLPEGIKKLRLKKGAACRQSMKGQLLLTVFIDKRQVSHLSTGIPHGLAVNSTKPIVNDDYNAHMGGVDLCDQNKSYYAVGRKARRWWKYIMWYLFGLSIRNAYLVRRASFPTGLSAAELEKRNRLTHKQFRRNLVEQLVNGYESNRRQFGRGARRVIPACVVMDPAAAVAHICEKSADQRVCYYCARKGVKAVKGGAVRTTAWCAKCEKHLCPIRCFQMFHAECCGIVP